MVAGIAPLLLQALIILRRSRREGQEAGQQLLGAGLPALGQKFLHVFGLFEVTMPFIASRVLGHELILMIEAEPVGIGLQDEVGVGITGRH
jgi:hypothetical protein